MTPVNIIFSHHNDFMLHHNQCSLFNKIFFFFFFFLKSIKATPSASRADIRAGTIL